MLGDIKTRQVISKIPKKVVPFNNPWKEGIFFIPLKFAGGFIVNTDMGQMSLNDIDIKDYSWKELIATGDGDLQLVWEDAITQETKKEKLKYYGLTGSVEKEDDVTTHSEITYGIGKYFFGYTSSNTSNFSITQNPSYNDFNTIIEEGTFELLVDAKDVGINEFSKFRLYSFPEIDERKVFYISNLVKNWNPNNSQELQSFEITFTRVSNKIQKSGKAIEEYFHFSPVGGCYPWPVVDREAKKITLDPKKMSMEGVVYVNEEYYNACIHNNTALIGWEVVEDEVEEWVGKMRAPTKNEDGTYTQKFYAPTVIHQKNFTAGESYILNRRALPESDISFLNYLNFSENKYTDWKKYWESVFSGDFDTKYQGECSYGDRRDMNSFEQLNDKLFNEDFETYYQSGVANPFVKSEFGELKLKDRTWPDINMYNFWCNRDIITLPFSFDYHILNQPKQWGLVGGIIDVFFMGFPFGWDATKRRILDGTNKLKDICGITSTSLINIAQKNWGDDKAKAFFLNDFYAKDSADRFNVANRTLAVRSQLENSLTFTSANFNSAQLSVNDCDTTWLGQQYINNGYDAVNKVRFMYLANKDQSILQLDSTYKVNVNNKIKKFVVCGISNKNFGAESMRFTFKDENGNNKWVGSFLTNSNFRNTSRDWANDFYCNYFNVLSFTGEQLQYPVYPSTNNNLNNNISIPYQREFLNFEGFSTDGFNAKYLFYAKQYNDQGNYNFVDEINQFKWLKTGAPNNDWFFRSNVSDNVFFWDYTISVENFPVGTNNFLQTFVDRLLGKKLKTKMTFKLTLGINSREGLTPLSTQESGNVEFKLSNSYTTKGDGSVDIIFGLPTKSIYSQMEGANYDFDLRNTTNVSYLNIGSNNTSNAINIKLLSFDSLKMSANFKITLIFKPDLYFNTKPLLNSGDVPKSQEDAIFYNKKTIWDRYKEKGFLERIKTKTTFRLDSLELTNEVG